MGLGIGERSNFGIWGEWGGSQQKSKVKGCLEVLLHVFKFFCETKFVESSNLH